MSKFKFKKDQEVRILHNNTTGKVLRRWDDNKVNEYLVRHMSEPHGDMITTVFSENELKAIDDPVFKSILIYLALVVVGIAAIIWSNY